ALEQKVESWEMLQQVRGFVSKQDALHGELLAHVKACMTSVLNGNSESTFHLAQLMASSLMKSNLSSFSTLESNV
ncbi:hypothetical protein KI387_005088, partial [Taxus chinensis]